VLAACFQPCFTKRILLSLAFYHGYELKNNDVCRRVYDEGGNVKR